METSYKLIRLALAAAVFTAACGGGSGGGSGGQAPEREVPRAEMSLSATTGEVPLTVHFDGSGSEAPSGGVLSFTWDLGNGEIFRDAAGNVTYSTPGTYRVRLTVTDERGLSDDREAAVVVTGDLPEETFASRVLHLTNLERRAQGSSPLKGEDRLDAAAWGHAADMASQNYFQHESADGRSAWDRMRGAGYDFDSGAENIAAGYGSPEEVVAGWMNSPGHRANLLNPAYRELGVGYVLDPDDVFPGPYGYHHYWVQDFGLRSEVCPVVIENEAFETAGRAVGVFVHGAGWAQEMRVSEDPSFAGSSWQPFAPEIAWELSPGPGLKRVCVRLRGAGGERTSCDEILLR